MAKKSIFGILLLLICISDSSLPVVAHHFFLLIRQRKLKKKTELTISDCHVKSKGSQELKDKKHKNCINKVVKNITIIDG